MMLYPRDDAATPPLLPAGRRTHTHTHSHTCALWMSATLPSQSTLSVDSSGRAVAQSMTVCTPTMVAGRDVMSVRSPCRSAGREGRGPRRMCGRGKSHSHLHDGGAPLAQEVRRVLSWPDKAAHVVALVLW